MRFISIHFTSLCRNLMQFIYLIFTAPAPAHEISGRMSSQFPNQRSSHLGQWCSPSQDPPSLAQKARLVRSGNGRRVEQLQKVSDCDSKSQLLSRSCRLRRKKGLVATTRATSASSPRMVPRDHLRRLQRPPCTARVNHVGAILTKPGKEIRGSQGGQGIGRDFWIIPPTANHFWSRCEVFAIFPDCIPSKSPP